MNIFWHKKKEYPSSSLNALVWKRFKRNKLALGGLICIGAFLIIAILGYLITPDSTPYCNQQYLELATQKPFSKATFLYVKDNKKQEKVSAIHKMLYGKPLFYRAYPIYRYWFDGTHIFAEAYTGSEPNAGEIISFNLADVVAALDENYPLSITSESISYHDIIKGQQAVKIEDLKKQITSKNIATRYFIFGTDRYGRDVLSQLIIGTRVSLSVGLIAIIIALLIGITLGALAAYYGKWVDSLIMWFINVVWSIPTVLLVIAITFALGKGFWQVFVAVGLTMWVDIARIVRGQTLSIREKEFVEAGKALGFSDFRIIFRHILPNIMGAIIVISASNFASAILLESGLSFLGIGVQPPIPSWGAMLKENYAYIILDSAYLAILPGFTIMLVVLAFMLVGNGLRDALDVKNK